MNEQQMRSLLHELTEQKAPAAEINLWPAVAANLETPHLQTSDTAQLRGTKMNTRPQQHQRLAAVIAMAAILTSVIFLLTPQGRAWAQGIIYFFNQGESNFMPGITVTPVNWVEQTPGVAAATLTPQPQQPIPPGPAFEATCGSYQAAHCSIEDIRGMVSFPVFALPDLPEGMHFTGATGGPDQVHLSYDTPNQTGFLLILQKPFRGSESQLPMEVGADAEIQNVQVGQAQAEYVKGSYDGSGNPPVWNTNLDLQQLRWVNQGVLFTLYHGGTQPRLSRDELTSLAASLTNGPVGVNGQPAMRANITATPEPTFDPRTLYPLTLAEAEEKAGFALLSPHSLPETHSFIGAAYDEQTKVVEISYIYHHPVYPDAQGGLLVRQQLAPEGVDCDLCGFIHRDERRALLDTPPLLSEKMLPPDATIETVQIGDLTGQYVQGVEYNGGQWDPVPFRKRLRFQINGFAVELWSDSNEMTKADLIAIAESLK